jgi:hypothetical protein
MAAEKSKTSAWMADFNITDIVYESETYPLEPEEVEFVDSLSTSYGADYVEAKQLYYMVANYEKAVFMSNTDFQPYWDTFDISQRYSAYDEIYTYVSERQAKLEQEEAERKRAILIRNIIIAGVVAGVITFIYFRRKKKEKNNED